MSRLLTSITIGAAIALGALTMHGIDDSPDPFTELARSARAGGADRGAIHGLARRVAVLERLSRNALAAENLEAWHEVGGGGEPPFENAWSNIGAGFTTAAFFQDASGFVHLKGAVQHAGPASAAVTLFTLPAEYRPTEGWTFPASVGGPGAAGLTARLTVGADGVVRPVTSAVPTGATWVWIDGVTFRK